MFHSSQCVVAVPKTEYGKLLRVSAVPELALKLTS